MDNSPASKHVKFLCDKRNTELEKILQEAKEKDVLDIVLRYNILTNILGSCLEKSKWNN